MLKLALGLMAGSGAARLARRFTAGSGIVFTLHRVRPFDRAEFAPNRLLEIEPAFLDAAIGLVRAQGYALVSLDEVAARIESRDPRPFAAFTLDDGYRDNREHAAPVFARHGCPYTIFVTSDFADGRGELWWVALERVIAAREEVSAVLDGRLRGFDTRDAAGKAAAFEAIYWPWRAMPERAQRQAVREFAQAHGLDLHALCRAEIMGWAELAAFVSEDPRLSIGAHTITHPALAKLSREEAAAEMLEGADRIERALGRRPRHLSFPYGDPASAGEREFALAAELGFATAATTRPGVIDKAARLTALPRVSLNGHFQTAAHLEALLSGLPFALMNTARRLRPAQVRAAASTG